jgi:hypothetical protein
VALPTATERVAVIGIGAQAAGSGTVPGWYAGQSLPQIGWSAAVGGGVVVTTQGNRVGPNRERGDGGWVAARELASAVEVVTVFTDPVNVIAVVVDDVIGGDAAAQVSIRLADATRSLDPGGTPEPPQALIDGVRTILLYAVETVGPNPRVFVDGGTSGQLAGVLGSAAGLPDLAHSLAVSGIAAAVQQPLVGGPGLRQVSIQLGDDVTPPPPPPPPPVKPPVKPGPVKPPVKPGPVKPPVSKKAAKKTAKKVAKKVAKKAATKKAAVKKTAKKTAKKGGRR